LVLALLAAGCSWAEGSKSKWERRDEWQNVPAIFAAMGISAGSRVADVGAGKGYLTLHLARAVGEDGRVYAVDIDAEVLEDLRNSVEQEKLENVTSILGTSDDPLLPEGSLDAVVMVNTYHEIDESEAVLEEIHRALRPGGRLVVVDAISESLRESSRSAQAASHEVALAYVREDLESAGFRIVQSQDPFVARPLGDELWLLVAEDARGVAALTPDFGG
jgi:ubiquinone/menaquinone biosynthesis C-methylase UbiE